MRDGPLLPSAERALHIVAQAQEAGTIHSTAWVKRLNDNAPDMRAIVDLTRPTGIRARLLIPDGGDRATVAFLAAPNRYAKYLDEFEAGARHLAEALQRPVLLVDPKRPTKLSPNSHGQPQQPYAEPLGIVTEGLDTSVIDEWSKIATVRCAARIHPPDPGATTGALPVYTVTLQVESDSSAWPGLPPTPLALSRWLPELDTYLDALRVWFDLHLD